MKRKLLLILALLIFIGTESWGQRFAPPSGEVTVSLSPTSLTMTVGEQATVTCNISGGTGTASWTITSGDEYISLPMPATGNTITVTANAIGSATIQCSVAGKTATCDVTVNKLTANSDGADTPSYWATYYNSTTSFTADANTTVFQAALSGDQLTLTVVPDREIPANKAVILKSSAATITLTPATTTQTLSGNQLQGTTSSMSGAAGNIYVLNKGTNGVGFYKLASDGTIGANKAYLTYSAPTATRGYFLFDETTGIEMPTVEDGNADAVFYDLQGRRVQNPTKGLYIVNGKKVFINK